MGTALNENKYELVDLNEHIPSKEPVFLMRAKDLHSVETLSFYYDMCKNAEHKIKVLKLIKTFSDWRRKNTDSVKEPD